MKFVKTNIIGPLIIETVRHGDPRGYFCETFRQDLFDEAIGRHIDFVQDNESLSSYGVVRGLHFQRGDAAQAKLVRVVIGEVLDVAVDLRKGSPTFGQHISVRLSAESGRQLFIPRGFAHGFAVLSPQAHFLYKADNYYCPEAEASVRIDDPDIAVDWIVPQSDRILSEKDLKAPFLKEITNTL